MTSYSVAVVGALGSGKSALTVKYITRRFIMEYDPTLEDVYSKTESVEGHDLTVNLMDTYHPHMVSTTTSNSSSEDYLRWAGAIIVVYSITSRSSFAVAKSYLELISQFARESSRPDIPVALVGNKVDLERYRTVSRHAGQELAAEYDCHFYETSAAEDYGSVEVVFHELIKDIARLTDQNVVIQPLYISEPATQTTVSNSNGNSHAPLKRTKSPKSADYFRVSSKKDEAKVLPRRQVSTFKLFNKSFKIFN
ncbi:hypothetical protein CAPTEDRAFT_172726 [Capitella teleta]|uniref:small monomeric GTPase n=1 Tax=Capitella teleta TaxID=283909 RepID=R7V498_CAPTE|nr:hypothetical protein CAPTEDRAFT_172726 [Capitella teleta]|eukprot:ELU13399.1 hypothetical protein CAPTEDRAFT_172726 [Capitella teleta]